VIPEKLSQGVTLLACSGYETCFFFLQNRIFPKKQHWNHAGKGAESVIGCPGSGPDI
jgi:hypothetical protein